MESLLRRRYHNAIQCPSLFRVLRYSSWALCIAVLVQAIQVVYLSLSLEYDNGSALLAQRMMSSSTRRGTVNTAMSQNDAFSACLLTMDDNHYLIEWIAYHYTILPLRHLIVAVDPKSKTSPSHIFKRWKQYGLVVEEWSDVAFGFNSTNAPWATVNLNIHRRRQRAFYTQCMKKLKGANRTWVTITDVDEYITFSSEEKHSSFASYLNQYRQSNNVSPCLMIPRLRYGAKESTIDEVTKNVPQGLNASTLLTMRHRHHAPLDSVKLNRFAKAIVDVSRVNESDIALDTIHRPIDSICPDSQMTLTANGSSMIINHYLGTWQQFSFRDDARTELEGRRTFEV